MAVTYEQAVKIRDGLKELYGDRHEQLRRMRNYWHGTGFWDPEQQRGGLFSWFGDLIGKSTGVGPQVKMVQNVLHQVCVKYQTYLAPLPMIRVPVDAPQSKTRRQQSNRKERILYGTWNEADMYTAHQEMAWYLPLMGDVFVAAFPDFAANLIRPVVRSPEWAYPIPRFDGGSWGGLEAVIFCWEVEEDFAKRAFPNYRPKKETSVTAGRPKARLTGQKPESNKRMVEILEFSDRDCFYRWVEGKQVSGVDHELGFNIFDQQQFIHVAGEVWGHGAVEQQVAENEFMNATQSLVWQAMLENVFPSLVLEDPSKAPEQILRGPGSVLPLNPGGKAYYLTPPVQALPTQVGLIGEMERHIKEGSGMPDVNFGQFKASIVTGKAINELQGAGTGTTIEMVQANMGSGLVSWNAKALTMYRELFRDELIHLTGLSPRTFADLAPRTAQVSFRGADIVGSVKNEVIYSPAMDGHTKLIMTIQAQGAGLVSKKYSREQIGIPDSEAMEEEILAEALADGAIAAIVQQIQDPEGARSAEEQATAFIEGTSIPKGQELPALPSVNPTEMGLAPGAPPAGGPVPQQSFAGLPGAPPAGGPPPGAGAPAGLPPGLPPGLGQPGVEEPEAAAGGPLTLDQAVTMFQQVQGLAGRVFLVGRIVTEGMADELEVALTDRDDRQAIIDQLPQLTGRVSFSLVDDTPDEAYVEVGPDGGIPGGAPPDLDAILG